MLDYHPISAKLISLLDQLKPSRHNSLVIDPYAFYPPESLWNSELGSSLKNTQDVNLFYRLCSDPDLGHSRSQLPILHSIDYVDYKIFRLTQHTKQQSYLLQQWLTVQDREKVLHVSIDDELCDPRPLLSQLVQLPFSGQLALQLIDRSLFKIAVQDFVHIQHSYDLSRFYSIEYVKRGRRTNSSQLPCLALFYNLHTNAQQFSVFWDMHSIE